VWQLLDESYTHESRFELVHNFNNSPGMFNDKAYNEAFGIEG
jgi:hypothetical protein